MMKGQNNCSDPSILSIVSILARSLDPAVSISG
jgi:hypothetical protein